MGQIIRNPQEVAHELENRISKARNVVFFGGAGVSTASGIPDFRSPNGLYRQKLDYSPEEMLEHSFFIEHTQEFYDFYRTRMIALDARPNQAHLKLAELEREGKLAAVVTQNIDGLHQAAGSHQVYELHGSVHRNICQHCGKTYSAEWIVASKGVPHCEYCGGLIKPDVVLYGEPLNQEVLYGAATAIAEADMLIVGGTSLVVYPAAGLAQYFQGNDLAIVNMQSTPQDAMADLVCVCDIAKAFDF